MSHDELRGSLEELHAELLSLGPLDEASQEKVDALARFIRDRLDSPAPLEDFDVSLEDLLQNTAVSLDVAHPKAARLISHLMTLLGNIGI